MHIQLQLVYEENASAIIFKQTLLTLYLCLLKSINDAILLKKNTRTTKMDNDTTAIFFYQKITIIYHHAGFS